MSIVKCPNSCPNNAGLDLRNETQENTSSENIRIKSGLSIRENREPTAGVNFINVKRVHFSYERLFSSYILALNKLSYEKFARLTLMKLTASDVDAFDVLFNFI